MPGPSMCGWFNLASLPLHTRPFSAKAPYRLVPLLVRSADKRPLAKDRHGVWGHLPTVESTSKGISPCKRSGTI